MPGHYTKPKPGSPKPPKKGPAKKLSPKQKKIASMGGNPMKIDKPDFSALRKKK